MKKRLTVLFFAICWSFGGPVDAALAQEESVSETVPETTTPVKSPSCGRWLLEGIGEPEGDPAQLRERLRKAADDGTADPFCRLRALYLLADQTPGDAAEKIYLEGIGRALALLQMQPGWEKVPLKKVRDRLEEVKEGDVPALFWLGYFWGHQIKYVSPLKAASQIKHAVAILHRVTDLQSDLYAGGAPAFLGGYYAELPGFWGRDLGKSAGYFKLALDHAQGNLMRRWTHARALLSKTDAAAYRRSVEEIAAATLDPAAEYYLESALIQKDAKAVAASGR